MAITESVRPTLRPTEYRRHGVQRTRDGQPGWRLRPIDPKSGRQLDRVVWGSYEDAVLALSAMRAKLADSTGPSLPHAAHLTVGLWAPVFLERYRWKVPPNGHHPGVPRPSATTATMRHVLSSYVVPGLGANTRLQSITGQDCFDAVTRLTLRSGQPASAATMRTAAEKMKSMLQGATSAGILTVNPAGHLPTSYGSARSKVVIPSMTNVELLATTLGDVGSRGCGRSGYYADTARLLAFTGMRISELVALRVFDVDFARSVISITKRSTESGGKRATGDVTKTTAGERELIILDPARPILGRLLDRAGREDPLALLIPGANGGMLSYAHWRKALAKASAECGVDYSAHDLRHVCASMMIASGATAEQVREQLGHSSTHVTERVYRHLWKRDRTKEAAELSRGVRDLLERS